MTALKPRPKKLSLRTSVIVPCSHKHVRHLVELLQHLSRQSRKPDEIIVALSGCSAPALPPAVKLLHSPAACTAGRNRNRAADAATADLLIYQDADDVPHPQRIEIVAGLFESYEIDHLMHGYIYTRGKKWSIDFPNGSNQRDLPIKQQSYSIADAAKKSVYRSEPEHSTRVTNGEIAALRFVVTSVKWPDRPGTGTDMEFNKLVYNRFRRTATTPLPLITYRHELSSFR